VCEFTSYLSAQEKVGGQSIRTEKGLDANSNICSTGLYAVPVSQPTSQPEEHVDA
jgi:hypothetical protein